MSARLRPGALGALVGFGGVAVVTLVFLALSDVPTTVPALLLLVPITGAALLADWRVSLPVAIAAGAAFSLAFLPPTGTFRVGLTQDVFMAVTFVVVAVAVSVLTGRRSRLRREALIDAERMALLRAVAHDLRSPLHTIQAVTGDLLDGEVYDEATRDRLLAVVHGESQRLERIVGNVLSLSRLRAGAFAPERRPEAIGELIDGCADRLHRLRRDPVAVNAGDDLPPVLVDRVQIDQLLVNLLDNAQRHSRPGSPVAITATADGAFVAVSVDDTGPGFTPAQLAAPFDGFRSTAGSAGLGLTVCKAIVEAHGGTIALGVNPDGGARVTFRVPVAR